MQKILLLNSTIQQIHKIILEQNENLDKVSIQIFK